MFGTVLPGDLINVINFCTGYPKAMKMTAYLELGGGLHALSPRFQIGDLVAEFHNLRGILVALRLALRVIWAWLPRPRTSGTVFRRRRRRLLRRTRRGFLFARVSWRVRARAPKGHSAKLVVGFLLESLLTLYHDDLF
jgi:hypothetical protein